jgi:hypothetical protein
VSRLCDASDDPRIRIDNFTIYSREFYVSAADYAS